MSAESLSNLNEVFRNGLCTRCGTCIGLSDGAVRFADQMGRYTPELTRGMSDTLADRIWRGCSAQKVSFPELKDFVFGKEAQCDPYLGHVEATMIGFANDSELRRKCASGGIITSVLIWLLKQAEIAGALVLGMDEDKPWQPKPYIATNPSEVMNAAQSKYIITSVNQILPAIETFQGDLAYVGLPCQVHSIRKLQLAKDKSVRNIKFIIGLYCGNTLHFSSIRSLLKSYGVDDHTQIESLAFREGEWPGNTRITLKSGQVISLPKFHANYLIPFHIMKRCLLCTDLSNEFTDISVGDAWAPVYEERGKGFSMVVARTKNGHEFLQEMQQDGVITLQPIDVKTAVAMHSHGYDLKKRGAFIRIRFRSFFGRAVPEYGYELKHFPIQRYLLEVVIDILLVLMRTKSARFILERISPRLMGAVFKKLRVLWILATRNVKRKHLTGIRNVRRRE